MTSERLFNSFIPPSPPQKKLLYPPSKFLATPLVTIYETRSSYSLQTSLSLINDHHIFPAWNVLEDKTRKPSWRKGYARQRRHSKMAVSRHFGYYRTGNSAVRFADPENPCLEPDMEWIGCTVSEILAFKLYCDLETGVRGHSRSSKSAPLDRPTPKTWL